MSFESLGLIEPLLRAICSEGYTNPTDIQAQAFTPVAEGRDLLGCAQTGTGKTAAFALPVLQRLYQSSDQTDNQSHASERHGHGHRRHNRHQKKRGPRRHIRVLVLTPTRELAAQVGESFGVYGRHTGMDHAIVFGGVKQGPQTTALRRGVDILVATPGRLLDLHGQGEVDLSRVEVFILDEADRMLDMGFMPDIRRVTAEIPTKRQTLLFSATMPKEIKSLANKLLRDPVRITIAAENSTADTVEQGLYHVDKRDKQALLNWLLESDGGMHKTLVFARTKRGADRIAKRLTKSGFPADAIHGDKSQGARTRALDRFRKGATWVLVASDVAARGLDVDDITHVINYDLPNDPETYVHRIGRTGRAGADGQAISFCSEDERDYLRDIERMIDRRIPVLKHSLSRDADDRRTKAEHPLSKIDAGIDGQNRDNNGGGDSKRRRRRRSKRFGEAAGSSNNTASGTKKHSRRRRRKKAPN